MSQNPGAQTAHEEATTERRLGIGAEVTRYGRKVGVQGLIRPEVSFSVKTVARLVGKSDRSPIQAWKTGPGAPFPRGEGVVKKPCGIGPRYIK